MPMLVQCPNPACKASCSVAEPAGDRPLRCPKCLKSFVVKPTADWRKGDTNNGKPASDANPFPVLPAEFGRYRILKLLGRGGMGAVYLAQDSQLGRQVALKVPFFGATESPQRAERFVREARSAAALDHPNICTVFDAGQIDGRPFITMAYIAGKPLEEEIDAEVPMPQVRAAEVVRKVALALEYAHRKGIVHRDLKPANVMLAAGGEPVVMDFGLAKRVADVDPNEAKLTRDGGILGTPSYMAPEQVNGEIAAIGPATDVYALGVMLFEMLTGKTPYRGALSVVIGRILTAPIPPVKEFRPEVDPRLDAICRRAMAKAPADRFRSMAELADALGYYLKAPSASPPPLPAPPVAAVVQAPAPVVGSTPFHDLETVSSFSPTSKKVKRGQAVKTRLPRKKGPIIAGAAAGLLLAGLVVLWAAGAVRLKTPDGTIVLENLPADAEVFVDGEKVALKLKGDDRPIEIQATPGKRKLEIKTGGFKMETQEVTLASGERKPIGIRLEPVAVAADKPPLPAEVPSVSATPALEALRRDQLAPEVLKWAGDGDPNKAPASLVAALGEVELVQTEVVRSLAFSADGRWLASGSYDKTILLRELATGRVKRVLKGHTGWITSVAFSKDGKTLVSASQDGAIKLWPLEKAEEPQTLQPDLGPIWELAVSSDGRIVAAGGTNGGLKVWKWRKWDAPLNIPGVAGRSGPVFNGARNASLALSPDGEMLAVAREEEKEGPFPIHLYRTADGKRTQTLPCKAWQSVDLAFSPDGKYLASNVSDGALVWDLADFKQVAKFGRAQFGAVSFSKDGKSLAVAGRGLVAVNDVASQKQERVLPAVCDCFPVLFSPDGSLLAGGFANGIVHVWDTTTWKEKYLERGPLHFIGGLALSPDGATLLSVGDDDTLRRWDLARPGENRILQQFDEQGPFNSSVAYSPDGRSFALVVNGDGNWGQRAELSVWDAASAKIRWSLPVALWSVAFSPDGKTLAGTCWDGSVRLWDAAQGREEHRFDSHPKGVSGLAFSKDGKLLAAFNPEKDGAVKIWNVASGAELHSWQDAGMTTAAFRPDGQVLAVGHADGTISLWDVAEGKKKRTLSGHSAAVPSLKYTPDGKTLISSGEDGTIRVWNPDWERARQVVYLGPPNQRLVMDLDASGKYAFVGGHSPVIFVLRLPPADERASSEGTQTPGAGEEPVDAAWLKKVAALPVNNQADAVAAKLKDLNPGFDGPLTPVIEDGVVTELCFGGPKVRDISPLRAWPGLRTLMCAKAPLTDLSPLKGMKLTSFSCCYTPVYDLTPLKDMRLDSMDCAGTRVSDLTPLKDMKLTALNCANSQVTDLSPLKGIPLNFVNCAGTQVSDLSPLKDMKLICLNCGDTRVSDLSPLKDMMLSELLCQGTSVSDLTPLKNMKLRTLCCGGSQVTGADLPPLQEMSSLLSLDITGPKMTDAGLEHLEKLTYLESLFIFNSKLTGAGLVHLKGMTRLQRLCLYNTELTDEGLIHLKDLVGLRDLDLRQTRVTDAGLEHLAGLKNLSQLDLGLTAVTDKGVAKLKAALPNCNIDRRGL